MSKQHASLTASAFLALSLASTAFAQEVPTQVQALAAQLAGEGFSQFTLQNAGTPSPTLVAEREGLALTLTLDPNSFEIRNATVAIDEDGDGQISAQERRRAVNAGELPEQVSDRARAAVEAARVWQREGEQTREQEMSSGANAPDTASQERGNDSGTGDGGGGGSNSGGGDNGGGGGGGAGSGGGGGSGRGN